MDKNTHNQLSMMDMLGSSETKDLKVVHAAFLDTKTCDYKDLFCGFDELYAITFSSGTGFINKVLDFFSYAEVIFGCEGVMSDDLAAIMAMQVTSIKKLIASKTVQNLAERLEAGSVRFYASRDTRSHEKIYVLRAHDGRTRVITGSANMSASAFMGLQRENILSFDDETAFSYYLDLFETFKEQCADHIPPETLLRAFGDASLVEEDPQEIPIIKTIEQRRLVLLEEAHPQDDDSAEIVAQVKGLEKELKPLLPRAKKEAGKVLLTGELLRGFKRKYTENRQLKAVRERQLPKLHIDYERGALDFNGKAISTDPAKEALFGDVACLLGFLTGLESFYGDVLQNQKDYFKFMSWYFAAPFMPYLRYVASKNNYDVTPFPVVGILYGASNGGKSSFIRLLTKLMCGKRIPMNSTADFTATNIEALKRGCEGLPINIDDLARQQFQNHNEKIIKDDEWGLPEGFINYPAVAITTNKLASLPPDISKRVVAVHIDIRIDKEAGAKSSRRINEAMRAAKTALFGAYAARMLSGIQDMEEQMKSVAASGGVDYFPDIFALSSGILRDLIAETDPQGSPPAFVEELSYTDYFGDTAVGRNAMMKIKLAWEHDRKQFKADRKNNTLSFMYPENGRMWELREIQQELPPVLNARLTPKSIVMDLREAEMLFGVRFGRRRLFG